MMQETQRCALCHRNILFEGEFCQYHATAYQKLLSTFRKWEDAYGKLGWQDYLKHIGKLRETGEWVKDVTKYELESLKKQERRTNERLNRKYIRENMHFNQPEPDEGRF